MPPRRNTPGPSWNSRPQSFCGRRQKHAWQMLPSKSREGGAHRLIGPIRLNELLVRMHQIEGDDVKQILHSRGTYSRSAMYFFIPYCRAWGISAYDLAAKASSLP